MCIRDSTYSIDNKEVATVSDKGVVTAVAEGKATVTITVLDKKLTCPVDVIASVKNEFPLLKYNVLNDEEDPEVSSYEKQMGRTYGKILYGGNEFYGYQNKDLDLIPGALYGLNNKKTGEQVIIALSKEDITNFPKTRILLKEYGFSNIAVSYTHLDVYKRQRKPIAVGSLTKSLIRQKALVAVIPRIEAWFSWSASGPDLYTLTEELGTRS